MVPSSSILDTGVCVVADTTLREALVVPLEVLVAGVSMPGLYPKGAMEAVAEGREELA